jgi:hypothetical protein
MVINSSLSGSAACYFIWEPAANSVDLVDDSGNNLMRTPVGGSGMLSNSQCSIPASTVSATFTGSTITVAATVTFTGAFAGSKSIWATWYSTGAAQGRWRNIGSWTVPAATSSGPTVNPSSGSGTSQRFYLYVFGSFSSRLGEHADQFKPHRYWRLLFHLGTGCELGRSDGRQRLQLAEYWFLDYSIAGSVFFAKSPPLPASGRSIFIVNRVTPLKDSVTFSAADLRR